MNWDLILEIAWKTSAGMYALFILLTIIILPKKRMFSYAIFRWRVIAPTFGIMYVLSVLLFPMYYLFRKPIRRYKILFFWWFLDSSEPDYISNTYGASGGE